MTNQAGNGARQRLQTAEQRSGGGARTGRFELRLKCCRQGLSFGRERWRRTIFASGGFQNRAHSRWTIVTDYHSETLASQSLDVLYREHEGLLRSIR